MRSAEIARNWDAVFRRSYPNYIRSIDLGGFRGLPGIEFEPGICAVCGLNGAGKSTVLGAVKDVLGLHMSPQDLKKLGDGAFWGEICVHGELGRYAARTGERLSDARIDPAGVLYLDYQRAGVALQHLLAEENLDELLEQYEPVRWSKEELRRISYLIGREYESCVTTLLDEVGETWDVPYFEVASEGCAYQSTEMGTGEHFLFYTYWWLRNAPDNSIVLMEEPETHIGILSQERLMNLLSELATHRGFSFLISTHSPYILERLPARNIRLISRVGRQVDVLVPDDGSAAAAALGLPVGTRGTIFVEDAVARLFLRAILQCERPGLARTMKIVSLAGEGEITARLRQEPRELDYALLGVYDGDMRGALDPERAKIRFPVCFLPLARSTEEEFCAFVREETGRERLARELHRPGGALLRALSATDGADPHDFLCDFCRALSVEMQAALQAFYHCWRERNAERAAAFLQELDDAAQRLFP